MNHFHKVAALFALSGVTALAGCGGGGDGSAALAGGGASGVAVVVGTDAPNVTAPAGYNKIIGTHAVSFFSVRDSQLQQTNGAERASDGAVIIADELDRFTGSGGYDSSNIMLGDIGRLTLLPTNNTYDTATMYSGGIGNTSTGTFYSILQGTYGIEAPASAITSTGTAVYNGDAIGRVYSESLTPPNTLLTDGVSLLAVDFGSGTADLTMDQFSYGTTFNEFDEVRVNGMSISGNRLNGGNAILLKNGAVVDAMGANTEASATAAFYGTVDGTGVPDEVGGQVYFRGDSNSFVGTFVGD